MSKMTQRLLPFVLVLCFCTASYGQADCPPTETATFVFLPGDDMFLLKGNETELARLCALVDDYRTEIATGAMPVRVDGYCASLPTAAENLHTAFIRANRVKSELILQKGLKEADFVTANYARAYLNNNDMVVVTLRIPAKGTPQKAESAKKEPEKTEAPVETAEQPQPAVENEPVPEAATATVPVAEAVPETDASAKSWCLAVRTNLLYDAFLLPTLGVEWRVNRDLGIKLDGSFSWWGNEKGKVQKMWLVNPEVRWYLLDNRRFYVGASGTYGEYNIYKYMLGSLLKDDTGYQGKLWNAGVTVGYQLRLCRQFSVDFNLGLGYTCSTYDNFGMTDGVRVYKERNKTKNFWGPTQAGISLVWTLGGNK